MADSEEDDFGLAFDDEPGSEPRPTAARVDAARVDAARVTDAVAARNTAAFAVALSPDDFQRIGLQPRESRLTVIRRAAMRTSKSLASRQLSEPSLVTEHQLSRVALSTYRVLDPRQRLDAKQRAHVGRIRPGTLLMAERAAFADGRILARSSRIENFLVGQSGDTNATASHDGASVRRPRGVANWRTQAQRPEWIVAMIVVLLSAAIALWFWGKQNQRQQLPWMRPVAHLH